MEVKRRLASWEAPDLGSDRARANAKLSPSVSRQAGWREALRGVGDEMLMYLHNTCSGRGDTPTRLHTACSAGVRFHGNAMQTNNKQGALDYHSMHDIAKN